MRSVTLVVLWLLLAGPMAADAGHVSVEAVVGRIFTDVSPTPYEVTADFEGTLTIHYRGSRLEARAEGSYREWRSAFGQPKRRQVAITTLDVPLLLRPFTGALKRLIEERVEQEEGTLEILPHYDFFIIEDAPDGRVVIGGIRRDIVTEVLERFGRANDAKDEAVRRHIARWLYQPTQRRRVIRSGGPYLVTVVTDEQGTLYHLVFTYDWGEVETQIAWATVSGISIWREVKMDTSTELRGLGRVGGILSLKVSNHCYNCKK